MDRDIFFSLKFILRGLLLPRVCRCSRRHSPRLETLLRWRIATSSMECCLQCSPKRVSGSKITAHAAEIIAHAVPPPLLEECLAVRCIEQSSIAPLSDVTKSSKQSKNDVSKPRGRCW